LIVEDDPNVSGALCVCLEEEGCECHAAPSTVRALELLEKEDYALMIYDVGMEGVSGLEGLSTLREMYRDMATIVLFAAEHRDTAISALRMGADGCIANPPALNAVIANVVSALERHRLTLETENSRRCMQAEIRHRAADARERERQIAVRLVRACEYRDDETGEHIRRIGLYCAALAEALGWDEKRIDEIRLAGPMHDVGKVGVPDCILLKPGELTAEERKVMERHTEIGSHILGGAHIPLLQMAAAIAVAHHEKWDGSGYPLGLAGEAIPECARLAAVADVYDALVHERVYRPAIPEDEAVTIMAKERGAHFDPRVYDCFVSMLSVFHHIREEVRDTVPARTPESCRIVPAAPS
jgi:putative two-component system response regulator